MNVKFLIRAAILLALIAVGARIQIPLPYFDYYTLQFTFVLLAGVILPVRYALLATGGYVLLGLLGVPIFAGGSGVGYVLRPSFGYLLGFVATTVAVSYVYHKKIINTLWGYYGLNTMGIFITYLFGLTYKALILAFYMNKAVPFWIIFTSAMAFDIPADFVMIFLLSLLELKIIKAITVNLNRATV